MKKFSGPFRGRQDYSTETPVIQNAFAIFFLPFRFPMINSYIDKGI